MEEKFTLSLTEGEMIEPIPLEQAETEIKARSIIAAESMIIIGRILNNVKSQLEHGQFTGWLEKNIGYSHSTANNLMRIARNYEATPSLSLLSYSKALVLLDIPADEREAFIAQNDVDAMSTREIKQLIKEKKAAEAEAERHRIAAERNAQLADQYSQAYYSEHEKLTLAQQQLESAASVETVEVEVPVEVMPSDYHDLQSQLDAAIRRAADAEAYAEEQEKAYMDARAQAQRLQMQQIENGENLSAGDMYSVRELGKAVQSFMGAVGTLPHMSAHFATMSPEMISEYRPYIDTLSAWVESARATLCKNSVRIVDAVASVE